MTPSTRTDATLTIDSNTIILKYKSHNLCDDDIDFTIEGKVTHKNVTNYIAVFNKLNGNYFAEDEYLIVNIYKFEQPQFTNDYIGASRASRAFHGHCIISAYYDCLLHVNKDVHNQTHDIFTRTIKVIDSLQLSSKLVEQTKII